MTSGGDSVNEAAALQTFVLACRDGETWRECVRRHAEPHGLVEECLDDFDVSVRDAKLSEDEAAFDALFTWDCLPLPPAPEGSA